MFKEEKAQVSFEYLLTAVFGIMLAIGAAIVIQALRGIAQQAQAEVLTTRSQVLEEILQ